MRRTIGWMTAIAAAACGGKHSKASDAPANGSDAAMDASAGTAGVSVFQHHTEASRAGVYVDAALTKTAVATMHPVAGFATTISGPTYTQPLFLEAAIAGKDVLVVATEQNIVYALDTATGSAIWQTPPLATPVPLADLPCGNIDPLGITGTPYVDMSAGTIYFGAQTTPDGGTTKKHKIFALSLATGAVLSGWPVDVESAVPGFASTAQNQRGAVLVQGGVLYVPYGGLYGDCGTYNGWLVGVDVANPSMVTAWSTVAHGGGAWSAGGVSTDGTSMYVTTGNTFSATTWSGGDAVIRLAPGPKFSNLPADYFAPMDWPTLDADDLDMGTHAIIDAPSITPSALAAGFGKDGNIYLLDRANLGGVGGQLSTLAAANGEITGAITTYTTPSGTFIAFFINGGTGKTCPNGGGGNMAVVQLTAGSPPTLKPVWCAKESDQSLPITSMTDDTGSNAIVWDMGAKLYAYDAETGTELFSGGSLAGVHYFNTPIVAKGVVYVAGDNEVYAFTP